MRTFFLIVMIMSGLFVSAQFPYHPLPFKQSDFKKIKELGFTKLSVYKENGEERSLSTEVEYGKDGLIAAVYTKGVNEEGDSIVTSETFYKFDGKGRLVKEESNDEEYGLSTTVFTYDATGKLVKKQTATIDPPTYKYKYDAKGRLAEVNVTQTMPVYDDEGEWHGKTVEKPSFKHVYKYDAKGRLSEEWEYYLPLEDKADPPAYKTIWTYNDKNQVIQVRRINSEETEMMKQQYEYDKNGLISKSILNTGEADEVFYYDYCKGCKQSWIKD